MSEEKTTIDIPIDGEPKNTLIVRLRHRKDGSPTFQARRIIPAGLRKNHRNPYATKSLKTEDFETAIQLARRWERTLFARIEVGEPIADLPFDEIARSFLVQAKRRASTKDDKGTLLYNPSALTRERTSIERYLIPFFGSTDIRKISQSSIDRFLEWRMNYYIDGPGADENFIEYVRDRKSLQRPSKPGSRPAPSTINKDGVAFSKVLGHANREFDLSISDVPRIKLRKDRGQATRRRPRFPDEQWRLLSETSSLRAMDGPNARVEFERFVLWGFISFLRGTGMRVAEARWLQVKHLTLVPIDDESNFNWVKEEPEYETQKDDYDISWQHDEEGKRLQFRVLIAKDNPGLKSADHARKIIPTKVFTLACYHYLNFLANNLHRIGRCRTGDWLNLPKEQYLFIRPDGTRVESMATSFRNLLDACKSEDYPTGLRRIHGQNMSLSCIRHTYASKQIELGATRNGLGLLADNMGTSPEMLRKHYSQELHELNAADLQLE